MLFSDNPGVWFTEYAYIDIDDVEEGECGAARTETDGLERKWAPPHFGEDEACLVLPPKPVCAQAGWTRVNHLGNGRDGVPLRFDWTLPHFPSGRQKLAVVRVR